MHIFKHINTPRIASQYKSYLQPLVDKLTADFQKK